MNALLVYLYMFWNCLDRSAKGITGNIAEGYGRYHYLDSLCFYSIARGELNETLARLIDARVLNYLDQEKFEELYKLIRSAEQTLNGYMNYVRRQKIGSQEFDDKAVHEDQAEYDVTDYKENNEDDKQE